MADAPNDEPKSKGRGFFEVGLFKKRRVTDAVRNRRLGSEFVVQVRHTASAQAQLRQQVVCQDMPIESLGSSFVDGLSSFKFQIGLFRLVCSNGLVVMDTSYGDFKLRHMGYTFNELQTKVSDAIAAFPGLVQKINEFQNIELSDWQVKKFAKGAALVRFGENVKVDIDELAAA